MKYTCLETDEAIFNAIDSWKEKSEIAVDFECEYNLHVYGEHLSIIQIFDGESYFVIDVLSPLVTKKGLEAFFKTETEKVWFDTMGDASLLFKLYGIKIKNPYDLKIVGKTLGYSGNLLGLIKEYLGVDIAENKKKNQQANWLIRPLKDNLIDYALKDVEYLIPLKEEMLKVVREKSLVKRVKEEMKRVNNIKSPKPGWANIPYYKRMTKEEKSRAKALYIARDNIAKRFNVPASRVVDKHTLKELSLKPVKTEAELKIILSSENPRFIKFVLPSFLKVLNSL